MHPVIFLFPIHPVSCSLFPLKHEMKLHSTGTVHLRASQAHSADSPTEILGTLIGPRLFSTKKPFKHQEINHVQKKRGWSMKQYPQQNGQARNEGCLKNRTKGLWINSRTIKKIKQYGNRAGRYKQESYKWNEKLVWLFSQKNKHTALWQSNILMYQLPMQLVILVNYSCTTIRNHFHILLGNFKSN